MRATSLTPVVHTDFPRGIVVIPAEAVDGKKGKSGTILRKRR